MNRSILLILFFIACTTLSSQDLQVTKIAQLLDSLPKIQGHLSNYSPAINKDLFINYTILTPEAKNIKQRTAPILENGEFTLLVDDKFRYQKIILQIGSAYKCAILAQNDVKIEIDLKDLATKKDNYARKGVSFTGTDGDLNEFYNSYLDYKTDKKNEIRKRKFSILMNRTSQTAYKIKQIRDIYEELEKVDNAFLKKQIKSFTWVLQNERESELYGDLAYIFIGKTMPDALWQECLSHQPILVSELSNRYYGILAMKIWSHEEKEIRALSRIIFNADSDDPEEKKEVDRFLTEQDKKKAGISYDNEIYAAGLEKFTQRYEEQIEEAKLDLFLNKLLQIPAEKVGLVAIKGQPGDRVGREKYLNKVLADVPITWQKDLILSENEEDQLWINTISELMKNSLAPGSDPKLGNFIEHMASGAGTWKASAESVPELLRHIRNYYKGKALIIYIWDTSCSSCIEELTLAGRTYDKLVEQPMEMLTLAINKGGSEQEWQKTLLATYAQGEHIYLSKKLSSELFEFFQLPPVPCYLYFDEDSNFVPNKIFSIKDIDIKEILSDDG